MEPGSPNNKSENKCPYSGPRHPQSTRDVTSKEIDGISDLVVWAPIKEGFIDAFSNVTYETRLRLVAEGLHNVRKSAREHQFDEPFADTAKRILSLLDFRIGIVDRDLYGFHEDGESKTLRPRKYMYLVATFDGPWEPYMRLIWDPLGTFLDLVLCNCEGYKPATHYSFEEYIGWVRDHQLDSAIFYSTSGLTVKDKIYLSELEKIQREEIESELKVAQLNPMSPDEIAKAFREKLPNVLTSLSLALEALNVLYKLADYYPPDTISRKRSDGRFLLRATKDLLGGYDFDAILKNPKLEYLRTEFKAQLSWYNKGKNIPKKDITTFSDLPLDESEIQKGILTAYDSSDDEFLVTHGALLLMQVHDPERTLDFFKRMRWSWEQDVDGNTQFGAEYWDKLFLNLGLTYEGFKKFGVSDENLKTFPKEFSQGLTARAPLIGDKYENHPRRWSLPKRFGVDDPKTPPVELSEVDFVIQVRCGQFFGTGGGKGLDESRNDFIKFSEGALDVVSDFQSDPALNIATIDNFLTETDPVRKIGLGLKDDEDTPVAKMGIFDALVSTAHSRDKLFGGIESPIEVLIYWLKVLGEGADVELADAFSAVDALDLKIDDELASYLETGFGFSILSVEDMFRPDAKTTTASTSGKDTLSTDHFGFKDGISQPKSVGSRDLNREPGRPPQLQHPEDVFIGDIVYGHGNVRSDSFRPEIEKTLPYNGSYMVVRKMSQDVESFNTFIEDSIKKYPTLSEVDVEGLVMGRAKDGTPIIDPKNSDNSFDYENDKLGARCPFSSHIRLANPRDSFHGRKAPMILRRGMTYGDRFANTPKAERGVMFMAYCANLAEQYETIQRWLNAGNASGSPSRQNDPLTGLVHRDDTIAVQIGKDRIHQTDKVFRAQHDGGVVRLPLPKRPFVKLEWGHYFFIPSKSNLNLLCEGEFSDKSRSDRAARGREIIDDTARLSMAVQQEEWKQILEDFLTKDPTRHDITPRIWEAIEAMGGAYKVESGIAFNKGEPNSTQKVILVTDEKMINDLYENNEQFSSQEQHARMSKTGPSGERQGFGDIFVNYDLDQPVFESGPFQGDSKYTVEAGLTNTILYNHQTDPAVKQGYLAGQRVLSHLKQTLGALKEEFKVELGRQYVQPALAEFSRYLIGVPNDHRAGSDKEPNWLINAGAWNWDTARAPVCPGDFSSLSLGAFYPRPSKTITDYSYKHGPKVRNAIDNYIQTFWDEEGGIDGVIANEMHLEMRELAGADSALVSEYQSILARNLVGIIIGSLPPMDANIRFTLFEWLEEKTLWRHQDKFLKKQERLPDANLDTACHAAKETLMDPLVRAMSLRPAPDLIYRTVRNKAHEFDNGVIANEGDMVILCLSAATQSKIRKKEKTDVNIVFGGNRSQAGHPMHACPAQKTAMGGMIGILAALLDCGRIQAMPASLIVRISEFKPEKTET